MHLDFRTALDGFAEGWTISAANEGAIKVPIVTVAQAEKAVRNQQVWKFDLETGLIFPREVRTTIRGKKRTVIRPGALYAERKAQLIPKEWLEVAGRTGLPPDWPKTVLAHWNDWDQETRRALIAEGFDPDWAMQALKEGSWNVKDVPVGATRAYPGVFVIMDRGKLTLGARKPYFFEYFPEEKNLLPGRICFRLVARAKSVMHELILKENGAIVLPPGVEEEAPRSPGYWTYITPDPKPYVLSDEAIEKEWLPPEGVAALPQAIQSAAPKEFRFWLKRSDSERLEARERLAEWYDEWYVEKRSSRSFVIGRARQAKFRLLEQTYKKQFVIRWGPSTLIYYFLMDEPKLAIALENSPLLRNSVAGIELQDKYWNALWSIKEKINPEPGTLLNPTKDTPSTIKVIDEGEAVIMQEEPGFLRLELRGEHMKGYWNVVWESEDAPFLVLARAKELLTSEGNSAALVHESKGDKEMWMLYLQHDEKLYEFCFTDDPGEELIGIAELRELTEHDRVALDKDNDEHIRTITKWNVVWEKKTDDEMCFVLGNQPYMARRLSNNRWVLGPLGTRRFEFRSKWASQHEQIVYGVVLTPHEPDAHGDIITEEEIRKAAHRYLAFGRQVGLHHAGSPIEAYVVESYVAPSDLTYENGAVVRKGEWVMAVWIPDKTIWNQILSGEFTGFSIHGWGVREPL
ncbi:MAG: XkdF-like putative serine protease domain-containing protein [Thermofilaceae archaeon]